MDEKIAGNSHISDKSRAWTDDSFYEAEKNENHMVMIANRIFEAELYESFTAEDILGIRCMKLYLMRLVWMF